MNLCYKCSIGRHSQHSQHVGRGLPTNGGLMCLCPVCPNNCGCYVCQEFVKGNHDGCGNWK